MPLRRAADAVVAAAAVTLRFRFSYAAATLLPLLHDAAAADDAMLMPLRFHACCRAYAAATDATPLPAFLDAYA